MKIVKTERYQEWLDGLNKPEREFIDNKIQERFGSISPKTAHKPGGLGNHVKPVNRDVVGDTHLFTFVHERVMGVQIVFGINGNEIVMLGTVPYDRGHSKQSADRSAYIRAMEPLVSVFQHHQDTHPVALQQEAETPSGNTPLNNTAGTALAAKFAQRGNGQKRR